MNTTPIIQSKQALEAKITSLVSEFKEVHGLSDIKMSVFVRHYNCGVVSKEEVSTDITATVVEDGAEIIIK